MSSCDEQSAKLLQEQATKYDNILAANSTSAQTNKIIQQAQAYLACDADCQRAKKEQELLHDYQSAQMRLFNGTDNLDSTSKNYYTFAKGDSGYNDFNKGKLGDVANQIAAKYSTMFNEIVHNSEVLNNVYQSDFINVNHAKELHKTLMQKNKELDTRLKDTLNDISTSDRKTYYEDQELDDLRWWYNIYLAIYIILLVTFVISSFLAPTEMTKYKRIAVVVFLALYIFLAKYAAIALIKLWEYIGSFFPKNVYLSI
jgi:hypothetical protein